MKIDGSDFVSEPSGHASSNRLVSEATLANQASVPLSERVRSAGTAGEIDFLNDDVLQQMSPPTGQTKSEFFKTTKFRGSDVASMLNEEFNKLDANGNGSIELKELGQSMKDALDSGDSERAQKLYAATQIFDIMDRFSNDEWGTEGAIKRNDLSRMLSMKELELRPGIALGVAEGRQKHILSNMGLAMNGLGLWSKQRSVSGAFLLASIAAYAGARGMGYMEYRQQKQFITDLYRP